MSPDSYPWDWDGFAARTGSSALEPIEGDERGPGRRTRVWLDGRVAADVAARSEAAILADLGGAAEEAPDRPRDVDDATATIPRRSSERPTA